MEGTACLKGIKWVSLKTLIIGSNKEERLCMCNLKVCGFPQRHKCKLRSIYDPMCANNKLKSVRVTNRLGKVLLKPKYHIGLKYSSGILVKVEIQIDIYIYIMCVNIDIIKGMIKCVLWKTIVHSDKLWKS